MASARQADGKRLEAWNVGACTWHLASVCRPERAPLAAELLARKCAVAARSDLPEPQADWVCPPVLQVAKNLLLRGQPSLVSDWIERVLDRTLGPGASLVAAVTSRGAGDDGAAEARPGGSAPSVTTLLAHPDPRHPDVDETLLPGPDDLRPGSGAERWVWKDVIPAALGPWARPLARPQVSLGALLGDSGFVAQRADFALCLPTSEVGRPRFLLVEVDGPDHAPGSAQAVLDGRRDEAAGAVGGATVRIVLDDLAVDGGAACRARALAALGAHRNHPFLTLVSQGWLQPAWRTPTAAAALQHVLVPLAMARVQRAVLEALVRGHLTLSADSWRLLVIERDVPCAWLALQDLRRTLRRLLRLAGTPRRLPRLELDVVSTAEFAASPLHSFHAPHVGTRTVSSRHYDLLIDVSCLQHHGQTGDAGAEALRLTAAATVVLRDLDVPHVGLAAMEPLEIAEPIRYAVSEGEARATASLVGLLRDCFRKSNFRPGQLPIIARALRRANVLGILPTGAGKSICYQLACLLQPSQAIVVAPLVALMHDQRANLRRAHLHRAVTLSNLSGALREQTIELALNERRASFILASPERLQAKSFRGALAVAGNATPCPIATLVIDEVHCVSEWGHDFRPAYLGLGRTARRWLGDELAVIGLTGTASFDVLADAAREVGGLREQDIIEADTFDRDELSVRVLPRSVDAASSPTLLHSAQKPVLLRNALLEQVPAFFGMTAEEFYAPGRDEWPRAGIIFCPHAKLLANPNSPRSVGWVQESVRQILGSAGLHVPVEVYSGQLDARARIEVQERFTRNQVALLVATTAFGMGIDKPNIRFVIHYSCSKSIEAFYQEIGRAGRDRQQALCVSVYSEHVGAETMKGAGEDPIEAWLSSREPGCAPPEIPFGEQDDRAIQMRFHQGAFPSVEEEKRALWSVGREVASRGARCRFSLRWRGRGGATPGAPRPTEKEEDERRMTMERAIYRLVTIGVVDDYTVDYNVGAFEISTTDLEPGTILRAVESFVARYRTPVEASEALARVKAWPLRGDTPPHMWLKAAAFLLDFVYQEIEVKRRGALRELTRVLREGRADPAALRLEIAYYFNSRYYRALQAHVRGCDLSVFWAYVEETQGSLDALRHLHGAVVRLLAANPGHEVFRLLRAYVLLSHPSFETSQALEYLDALDGAPASAALGHPGRELLGAWLTRLRGVLATQHEAALPVLDHWIARYHLRWLDNHVLRTAGAHTR